MNSFQTLENIIRKRRTIKPADMNGEIIDEAHIRELLALADWAPTHGRTEPWRFIVYEKEAKKKFCADHADLFKAHTDPEKFTNGKYEKFLHQGDPVSHIILVYMKRTVNSPIPVLEEIAAVSAATQNILLGASSMGIGALWSTGGMILHPSMKQYLGLGEEDIVMGVLYLGYADQILNDGKRTIPMEEKIVWKSE